MDISVGLYDVFLWEKNSSKKFEIKIVGKKEHRWEELARACGWLGRVVGLRMELYLCGGCGSVRDIVYF